MTDCNVGCAVEQVVESQAAEDRVEYKEKIEEVKEDMKVEEVPKLIKILGDQLLSKEGTVATKDLIGKVVVGIYFSAHWCPPCRRFTPRLAEAYKKHTKAGKSLEIVFVSSDQSEGDFQEYYKIMPWLALPFADRRRKSKLSQMFDVNGIPKLVLIDPNTGLATNARANQDILADTTGEKFPWPKPFADTVLEFMIDAKVKRKSGNEVVEVDLRDMRQKFLVLFFYDNTSSDCKEFLPAMVEWYNKFHPKLQDTKLSFDVLSICSADDEASYDDSFKAMPFTTLSFKEQDKQRRLCAVLRLQASRASPQVIVIDFQTGKEVTRKGKEAIEQEVNDTAFPWPSPGACSDVNEEPECLNSYPCIVLWLEEKSKDEQMKDIEMLTALAKEYMEPNGDRDFGFLYVTKAGSMSNRLRTVINQPDTKNPFTLIDFSMGVKYNGDNLAVDELKSVLSKYTDETLETVKLQ